MVPPAVQTKSMAPDRTCDTVSVSLPSWPFGNTSIDQTPVGLLQDVCAAASFSAIGVGWLSGSEIAIFKLYFAAWAKASPGARVVAASAPICFRACGELGSCLSPFVSLNRLSTRSLLDAITKDALRCPFG